MRHIRNLIASILGLIPVLTMAQVQTDTLQEATDSTETVLPEGMQSREVDSLLNEWNTRNFLIFDEQCETTGENPTFSDEEYIHRLGRLPNVIPMSYNNMVKKFIDQYSGRLRRTVSVLLGAGNFYFPLFEEALESYQLPLELKYLPIIESALNPKATSRAGAAGLWQFMVGTGKQYGLEVNSLVDERCDPILASYAAARYLKDLYNIFGDWHLVLACYNCGPGTVTKAIKRAGGTTNYWELCPYLPRETQGYVPAFIAANYILNHYCDHNICPVNTTLPQGTDTLMLSRDADMRRIAEVCGVDMDELKALNPVYRTNLIPGETRPSCLRMRTEHIHKFLEAGDTIYTSRARAIAEARKDVEENAPVREKGSKASKKGGTQKTVTVRKGDTLGSIAKKNGTTVEKLCRLNGIKGTAIREGQKLQVK